MFEVTPFLGGGDTAWIGFSGYLFPLWVKVDSEF